MVAAYRADLPLILFEYRPLFGRARFYALNPLAEAILAVSGKKSLDTSDLLRLEGAGLCVRVDHGRVENVDWKPRKENA